MTGNLIKRLRGDWPEILVEKHWMMDSDAIDKQREEAADRIEALEAENERLREVLRDVTPPAHFGESEQAKAWWAKARAALEARHD